MPLPRGIGGGRPPPNRSVLKDSRVRYEDLLEEAYDRQLPLPILDPGPLGGHRLLMSVVWLSFMSAKTAVYGHNFEALLHKHQGVHTERKVLKIRAQ